MRIKEKKKQKNTIGNQKSLNPIFSIISFTTEKDHKF